MLRDDSFSCRRAVLDKYNIEYYYYILYDVEMRDARRKVRRSVLYIIVPSVMLMMCGHDVRYGIYGRLIDCLDWMAGRTSDLSSVRACVMLRSVA